MVSFIIYFYSGRLENLKQTVRFLEKRENLDIELILVCQNKFPGIESKFPIKSFCLGLDYYNKPLMNNIGVENASGEIIVLLDSDRILPPGYFTKNISVGSKEVVSTISITKLERKYTDEQIENGDYEVLYKESRSKYNHMHSKNMCSGNTIMLKEDYLAIGGMDDSFIGYGYNDNDFTQTLMSNGFNFIWNEDEELHLWHDRPVSWKRYVSSNMVNGLKYCHKWNLKPTEKMVNYWNTLE